MSQHSRFTTILEEGLDSAFAEHGYLDGVFEVKQLLGEIDV